MTTDVVAVGAAAVRDAEADGVACRRLRVREARRDGRGVVERAVAVEVPRVGPPVAGSSGSVDGPVRRSSTVERQRGPFVGFAVTTAVGGWLLSRTAWMRRIVPAVEADVEEVAARARSARSTGPAPPDMKTRAIATVAGARSTPVNMTQMQLRE